jgi:hypothetical protein
MLSPTDCAASSMVSLSSSGAVVGSSLITSRITALTWRRRQCLRPSSTRSACPSALSTLNSTIANSMTSSRARLNRRPPTGRWSRDVSDVLSAWARGNPTAKDSAWSCACADAHARSRTSSNRTTGCRTAGRIRANSDCSIARNEPVKSKLHLNETRRSSRCSGAELADGDHGHRQLVRQRRNLEGAVTSRAMNTLVSATPRVTTAGRRWYRAPRRRGPHAVGHQRPGTRSA